MEGGRACRRPPQTAGVLTAVRLFAVTASVSSRVWRVRVYAENITRSRDEVCRMFLGTRRGRKAPPGAPRALPKARAGRSSVPRDSY